MHSTGYCPGCTLFMIYKAITSRPSHPYPDGMIYPTPLLTHFPNSYVLWVNGMFSVNKRLISLPISISSPVRRLISFSQVDVIYSRVNVVKLS